MTKKGSLPPTGQIDLKLDENQLGMLEKGLINSFNMDAVVFSSDRPDLGKRKIKLTIDHAHGPGSILSRTTSTGERSNAFNQSTLSGLSRAHNYLLDKIVIPNSWILFGRVGVEKEHLIVIFFYVQLSTGTYSFKDEKETIENFNPQMN